MGGGRENLREGLTRFSQIKVFGALTLDQQHPLQFPLVHEFKNRDPRYLFHSIDPRTSRESFQV